MINNPTPIFESLFLVHWYQPLGTCQCPACAAPDEAAQQAAV